MKRSLPFIVPVHNEGKGIGAFLDDGLLPVVRSLKNYNIEVIIVNDGSNDNTLEVLKQFAKKDKMVKVVSFSRNFRKENALSAGYRYARGCCNFDRC